MSMVIENTGEYTEKQYVQDTQHHILMVQTNIQTFIHHLVHRSAIHDASKLEEPEKSIFIANTSAFKKCRIGTPAYTQHLAKESIKIALDHHYANNSHHPQHYTNGILGMDLVDIIEMFCDCSAANRQHGDGDIERSILENQKRFGYSDELAQILINTSRRYPMV